MQLSFRVVQHLEHSHDYQNLGFLKISKEVLSVLKVRFLPH